MEQEINTRPELVFSPASFSSNMTRLMEQEHLQNAEIRMQQEREERIRRSIRVMNETAYGFMGVRCDYFYQGGFVQRPLTIVVPSYAIREAWHTLLLNHMLSGRTITQQAIDCDVRYTHIVHPNIDDFFRVRTSS